MRGNDLKWPPLLRIPPAAAVLSQLGSLRHLEVTLTGPGATFPRPPRRLASLAIHCSNTASLYTLVSLCKADRVTVTAQEDVLWNTSIEVRLPRLA